MARPQKTPNEKKAYRLIARLNADERKQVEFAAKSAGLKPYQFARVKILDGRFPKPLLSEIDLGVYVELKKIGVNINQLARVANSGRFPMDIQSLLSQLSEHLHMISKLLLIDRHSENR